MGADVRHTVLPGAKPLPLREISEAAIAIIALQIVVAGHRKVSG
jgi:hypothetical protein